MSRRGFTLIELLVVIAIIGLLAAILFPIFAKMRENGRRTMCLSNIRQISIAVMAYEQDHDTFFPPTLTPEGDWAGAVLPYAPANDVFRCPSCPVPAGWEVNTPNFPEDTAKGYAVNTSLYDTDAKNSPLSTTQVHFPSSTVFLCEFAYRSGPRTGETEYPSALSGPDDGEELGAGQSFLGVAGARRHNGGSNYAFVDGHAHWYSPAQVSRANQGNNGVWPSFAL